MKVFTRAFDSISGLICFCFALALVVVLSGCGGAGSATAPPPVTPSITVSAPSSTVTAGKTLQFTATITGSTGTAVWTVSSGAGTISSSGLYTAPATLPTNTSVTISASISSNSSVSASSTITLVAAPAIAISSPTTTAAVGNTIQFTASITGSSGSAVWSVSAGGGSISSSGLYTAPSSLPANPSATITATLSTDNTVTASTTVSIVALPMITGVSPASLPMGENNAITITGTGFVNGTVILLNGSPATTVYQSPTSVVASLSAEPGVASPVTLIVQNPASLGSSTASQLPLSAPPATAASIGTVPVLTIPTGFIGLSHEWGDGEWTMGDTARGVNTVYRQLLTNLMSTPNSPFLIRMGGGSTDSTTTPDSVQEFNELNAALPGVKFTTGVILGGSLSESPNLAYAEAQAQSYVSGMTPGILSSIEIGNETDSYQYSTSAGRSYTFDVFNGQYSDWTSGILRTVPTAPKFTGPSWSLMRTLLNDNYWSGYINEPPSYLQLFIGAQKSNTGTITQHWYSGMTGGLPPSFLLGYPLPATGTPPVVPATALQYANPGNTQYYWAPSVMGMAATLAHQNGMTFRVNEMNSVDGGGQPGTSDSFAAALWAVDIMFEFANAGVDGVNFHGANGGLRVVTPSQTCTVQGVTYQAPCTPTPIYAPFSFNIQHTNGGYPLTYTLDSVNPLYYGLYFFHLAVPDGSQLLPVTLQSPNYVKVWATKDSSGTIRIAVINKDINFAGNVAISLPGHGTAQTLTMTDANGYTGTIYYANNTTQIGTTGITIGGQTWDGSVDGKLQGTQSVGAIVPSGGVYSVQVQPATAVLLTVAP